MLVRSIRVLLFFILMSAVTGLVYPLLVGFIGGVAFPYEAQGSLISHDGKIVGSEIIGQKFSGMAYFHSRPSHAGKGYDANMSSGSNYGLTSKNLRKLYEDRVAALKRQHGRGEEPIPADLVAASGSGLDPHITPQAAQYQAARVARVRGLSERVVNDLIAQHTEGRTLGFLGMPRVNVLKLNLALDALGQP
ncbi:MAG: potassium-transporting ATPase subunit KdpC [Alphaproteobacteria bacterium]|nr:potassium-transporting ATPase subunit KdpC [Alphaproteobacteria bacterium]